MSRKQRPQDTGPLRILLTNSFISNWSGSELYIRDLALELKKRGHLPIAYSTRLGKLAQELRALSIPVVDDLNAAGAPPDLIHGQHHLETMTALLHFPGVPAVYFCHGWLPWEEIPPRHPQIGRYVAVSDTVQDWLIHQHGIPAENVTTILNFVDLERFRPRPLLPPIPARALVFSNLASEANFVPLVRQACGRHAISLEVVGYASGNPSFRPENMLGDYDLVFARGRAALESLAVGAAVVCCDVEGLGPLVTSRNLEGLRRKNFGTAVLDRPITADGLDAEIQGYDPADNQKVSQAVRASAGLTSAADRIVETYRTVVAVWAENRPLDLAADGRAASAYLQWLSREVVDKRLELEELRRIKSSFTWQIFRRVTALAVVRYVYRRLVTPARRWRGARRARQVGLPGQRGEAGTPRPARAYRSPDGDPMGEPPSHPPQLACVVISRRNPPELVDAVRSILSQDEEVEIVVANSDGGNPSEALRAVGLDVEVVNRVQRLLPGAARNLGIEATRAPYVSFLAADCIAEPGWVRERLKWHLAGSQAVSSAVTNQHPRNVWAWISHIFLFSRRMPDIPPGQALHYGVSYARGLFDRFGLFREDLRTGEDTEFNGRLAGKVTITWAPEVRSTHSHPTSLSGLLGDQFARGRRMARTRAQLAGRSSRGEVAFKAVTRTPAMIRLAWQATQSGQRPYVLAAALPMPLAVGAYALGALSSTPGRREAAVCKPRILTLLAFHNEMRYLPDYFRNVAPQVDGIVALDDGSTDESGDFVARQPGVLQLIRIPPREPHVWDEPRNRRMLVEAAWEFDAGWLIALDADERLERSFRERAAAEIERAEGSGLQAYAVRYRELWGRPDTYRVDGIWGRKSQARLFKARRDHEFDPRDLHGHWAPLNSMHMGAYPQTDLIIYHLRMIRPTDRQARRSRYNQLDPENRWQSIGYDYLTDEHGLRLENLPHGREYLPLANLD